MTPDKPATTDRKDDLEAPATPEDIAGLYTWAKLEGSKYRDFSESRNKTRADSRDRKEMERSRLAGEAAATDALAHGSADEAAPAPPPSKLAAVPVIRTPAAGNDRRKISLAGNPGRGSSRHGGASRWSALNHVFEETAPDPPSAIALEGPALAVVSLAGGVGKTSLVASLGRSLASRGESVLLVDANPHGLLPLYFGAHELGASGISTFDRSGDAPVHVMTMDAEFPIDAPQNEHLLAERIADHARGVDRVLIDIATGSTAITRQMLRLAPTVLFTLTPDMASVVSLTAAHTFFQRLSDETGRTFEPFYILNQFDASLRFHSDVHDLLARRLGDRLLPFAVRRSGAVSEALADGMTVVDYVPDAPIVEDLGRLSHWVRERDPLRSIELRTVRRREQSC